MAVTATHLDTNRSSGTTPTTNSISPSAGKLILLAVSSQASVVVAAPTVSGCGVTWVLVASVTNAGVDDRLDIFRAMGTPSSGVVTVTYGSSQPGVIIVVDEFDGVDTSGTNGSGAVRQPTTFGPTTTAAPSVTLAAFADSDNGTYGAFAMGVTGGFSAGSGFSTLGADSTSGPSNSLLTEWKNSNDTSVDASNSSASVYAIALELVAAPPVVTVGQAAETDTAQAIAHSKTGRLQQVVETDTAQTITPFRSRVVAVGQVTETDTAQPIAHARTKPFGQVVETDLAEPFTHSKSRTVGQAAETDTAGAFSHSKTGRLGQAVETDQALTISAGTVPVFTGPTFASGPDGRTAAVGGSGRSFVSGPNGRSSVVGSTGATVAV